MFPSYSNFKENTNQTREDKHIQSINKPQDDP